MQSSNSAAPPVPSLVFPLTNIIDRLDLAQIFPQNYPLEVELGSGDGSFLVNYAQAHPEHNFFGIERLLGRLRKLAKKARRAGLQNLRGLRIESAYFLEYLLPHHSTTALHLYFPDPWPKRKHRKNRLCNERFPQLAHSILTPSGRVYLRTDDEDYFQQMLAVFAASPLFSPIPTPAELSTVVTDFERNFHLRGIPTLSAAYLKVG